MSQRQGRFLQNPVGNPETEGLGTGHFFRPVGAPHSHYAEGLPQNWAGGDRGLVADHTNPQQPFFNTSPIVPVPYSFPSTFQPPLTLHITSFNRDQLNFPNPVTFRVAFPKPLRGVMAIELTQANIPNVDDQGAVPPGRHFFISFGLFNNANLLPPVVAFPGTAAFEGTSAFKGSTKLFQTGRNSDKARGAVQTSAAEHAIAKLNYDPILSFQAWERGQLRFIRWCNPIEDKMDHIDLSLVDETGAPYAMPVQENWSCTLEILCKQ